jgi:serine O-acetyltransferase
MTAKLFADVAAALADRAGLAEPGLQLPDPERVAKLCLLARGLLFAEVWTSEAPCAATLDECLRRLYEELVDLLTTERLARPSRASLRPATGSAADASEARQWARGVAAHLVRRLPELRDLVETDLQAAIEGDPAARSRAEVILCYPGFRAIGTHRIAHVLWQSGAHLVARLLTEQAHHITGIDLHPGATIGPGFFIDHGTGVVVGETAVIGARVRLYQGVTVGARTIPTSGSGPVAITKRHPTLEDDVVVYANATILGGDTVIGRGAIVGGNTWVTSSVPAGARLRVDGGARPLDAVLTLPEGHGSREDGV